MYLFYSVVYMCVCTYYLALITIHFVQVLFKGHTLLSRCYSQVLFSHAFVAFFLVIMPAVPFLKCCPITIDWWARSLSNTATIYEEAVGSNYCKGHPNSDIINHFRVFFSPFCS